MIYNTPNTILRKLLSIVFLSTSTILLTTINTEAKSDTEYRLENKYKGNIKSDKLYNSYSLEETENSSYSCYFTIHNIIITIVVFTFGYLLLKLNLRKKYFDEETSKTQHTKLLSGNSERLEQSLSKPLKVKQLKENPELTVLKKQCPKVKKQLKKKPELTISAKEDPKAKKLLRKDPKAKQLKKKPELTISAKEDPKAKKVLRKDPTGYKETPIIGDNFSTNILNLEAIDEIKTIDEIRKFKLKNNKKKPEGIQSIFPSFSSIFKCIAAALFFGNIVYYGYIFHDNYLFNSTNVKTVDTLCSPEQYGYFGKCKRCYKYRDTLASKLTSANTLGISTNYYNFGKNERVDYINKLEKDLNVDLSNLNNRELEFNYEKFIGENQKDLNKYLDECKFMFRNEETEMDNSEKILIDAKKSLFPKAKEKLHNIVSSKFNEIKRQKRKTKA